MKVFMAGEMVIMDLDEYNYLRNLKIISLPLYKDISIDSTSTWALNPSRIYVNAKMLKNNLRLLILAHTMLDKPNHKCIEELKRMLDQIATL